ncbi:MAG: hypothetical protein FWC62_02780 [Firmicutes bacterium]|nr:hypothetical protein [Bacillota bacterium]
MADKEFQTNENPSRKAEKPPEEKLRGKRLAALLLAILLAVGIVGGLVLLMFAPVAGAILILGYTPVGALMLWLLLRDRNRGK